MVMVLVSSCSFGVTEPSAQRKERRAYWQIFDMVCKHSQIQDTNRACNLQPTVCLQ